MSEAQAGHLLTGGVWGVPGHTSENRPSLPQAGVLMEKEHKALLGAGCLNEEVARESVPEADPRADDEPAKWGRQQTQVGGGVTSTGLLAQLAAVPLGDARPGPCAELGRSSRVTQKPHCAELGRSGHQRSRKHVLSKADRGGELPSSPRCPPGQTHVSRSPTGHLPHPARLQHHCPPYFFSG